MYASESGWVYLEYRSDCQQRLTHSGLRATAQDLHKIKFKVNVIVPSYASLFDRSCFQSVRKSVRLKNRQIRLYDLQALTRRYIVKLSLIQGRKALAANEPTSSPSAKDHI